MQQAYLDICGIPTRVITYGKWVEESFNKDEPTDIVICIPGNPGVTEFYCKFMQTLHDRLGYPVWIVGHAGHESPKDDSLRKIPELEGNERLYGLQGQVIHQYSFIEKYVPKNARIHFIGHSIGAYIILQLLKDPKINSKVVRNYLLFPTIEDMVESPNGRLLTQFVCYIVWLLVFLSWIFTFLPFLLQSLLIQIYTTYYSVPKMHLQTIINFVEPNALKFVFHMAFDEMIQVKERDNDVIIKNKDKLKFYYGAKDRWAPQSFYRKLKHDIPDIDAQVCKRSFEHAFVLRFSEDVGNMVADWIRNN